MPLTQPSVGGIARKNLLVSSSRFSDLNDILIQFNAIEYDPANNNILIAGDNGFCGILPDFKTGKVQEFPTLPTTVIANGLVNIIHKNGIDNGVIVRIGNNFASTIDGGLSWFIINPGGGTQNDISSWKDSQLVNLHRAAFVGAPDILVSTDNGATFPFVVDSGIGSLNRTFAKKTQDDKVYFVGQDAGGFAWTDSTDMTVAVFNSFPVGTFAGFVGSVDAFDANGDSSKGMIGDDEGNILVSIDGLLTWTLFDAANNYFRNAAGNFTPITSIVYVADIKGFIVAGVNLAAYIPEDGALNSMEVVSFAMTGEITANAMATDGIDLIATSNTTVGNRVFQLPFKP